MKNPSIMITASQMLKDKKVISEIDNSISFPIRRTETDLILAPPKNSKISFSEVGTAYDFWLRCHIIRNRMLQAPAEQKSFFPSHHVKELRGVKWYEKYYGDVTITRGLADKHLKYISNYVEKPAKNLTNFFKACLFFAKFETEYRSGILVDNPEVPEENLDELERLAAVTDLEWLNGKNIVGNPTFNRHGKKMKVNADGDFIIDHCLYELKVTSKISIKPVFRQLICYYILNKIGPNAYGIKSIGMYYPRFKYRGLFPIRDVLTKEKEKYLVGFFRKFIGK